MRVVIYNRVGEFSFALPKVQNGENGKTVFFFSNDYDSVHRAQEAPAMAGVR
jgi:hypothetical protein